MKHVTGTRDTEGGALKAWDVVIGKQNKGTMLHSWFGLDVKVLEHCVAVPLADKVNQIIINVGTQQGHGTGGSERTCLDMG